MDERSYQLDDKSAWEDGPWQEEPDKVVWVDEATNFDCMIRRNPGGALCGYVGVPEGHPWHGEGFDLGVDVHGGITFGGPCHEGAEEASGAVCHMPRPGIGEVWWLGFDCSHAWDLSPAHAARNRERYGEAPFSDEIYRDLAYVRTEVEDLAKQAFRMSVAATRSTP